MQLLIIAISLIVSITLMMGCLWRQFGSLFRSKSIRNNNNRNKNDSDVENVIKDNDINKVSKTDLNTAVEDHNVSESKPIANEIISIENTDLDSVTSFDEAMNACLKAAESLEALECVSKSRPRRSNIRRSTRKSKQLELDLTNNNNNDVNCAQNNVKDINNEVLSKNQLKDQISTTLSMFSARIEEVTRPLTPTTPNLQKEFDFQMQESNEELSANNSSNADSSGDALKPQITLIDRTKRIGSPLLNPAMFAELRMKQNKSHLNEHKLEVSVKASDNQISDKTDDSV